MHFSAQGTRAAAELGSAAVAAAEYGYTTTAGFRSAANQESDAAAAAATAGVGEGAAPTEEGKARETFGGD